MRVRFYEVAVGTWERGRTHTVCAESPEQAYDLAVREFVVGEETSDCYIVTIFEADFKKRRKVYDYLYGFNCRPMV